MTECVDAYEGYNIAQNPNKKLKWLMSDSLVTVEIDFEYGPKEFSVSAAEAACLSLFNNAEELTLSQISNHLKITDATSILKELNYKGFVPGPLWQQISSNIHSVGHTCLRCPVPNPLPVGLWMQRLHDVLKEVLIHIILLTQPWCGL